MTMSDLPPNVAKIIDRHGKPRYRFRRKGWKSAYLKGDEGSAAFHQSYADILAAGPLPVESVKSALKVAPRSLDDLYNRMKKTTKWAAKKDQTRYVQSGVLERFLNRTDAKGRRYGERPVANVTVAWLENIFGAMVATPAAANNLRKFLSGMLDYAVRMEWRSNNPARLTGTFKEGEDGFHTWTEEEIEQYRAAHALGTMARLTLELALNTAGRRCNVAQLTRDDIVNGRIITDHAKNNNQSSARMLPTTRAALEALPAAPIRHLVTTVHGKPFSDAGLGNRMRKWCDTADLKHCSMHGLRKATSRRLAESGATDAEGQAITGHKKAATFQKYRAKADRVRLADAAFDKFSSEFDEGE